MEQIIVEGNGCKSAVMIEFPSKKVAFEACQTSEYQKLSKPAGWANSSDTNISIIDGGITH